MANYFADTHGKPTWRKEGRHDGFRIVAVKPGYIRRLSRKIGVTCDGAGRWHIAFVAIPEPIPGPGIRRSARGGGPHLPRPLAR